MSDTNAPATNHNFSTVLDFWFEELEPKQWFSVDQTLDQQIERRFGALLNAAEQCELYLWRQTIEGRLAEIIVLDQFSRNVYRGKQESFANDPMALALAQEAIATGDAGQLPPETRAFLYMPYMHSESLMIHELAVKLFSEPGMENNLDFEYQHKKIIERFGRYPHRNDVVGRISTPEELEFLSQPGSSF